MGPYGGSVSQVAQMDMGLSAQQRAGLEFLLNHAIQQKRYEQENAYREKRDQTEKERYDQSQRDREVERQYRASRDSRMDAGRDEDREARLHERQMDSIWRRDDAQRQEQYRGALEQDREARAALPYFERGANEGLWGSEDEFRSAAPKSLWPYSKMFTDRSRAARSEIEAMDSAAGADAELMNRYGSLEHMKRMEETSPYRGGFSLLRPRSSGVDDDAIKEWSDESSQLLPDITGIREDKNRMGALKRNPDGSYSSALTPPWKRQAPVAAPQVQPKTPVVNPPAREMPIPEAVEILRRNDSPRNRQLFDQRYYPGAAEEVLGLR